MKRPLLIVLAITSLACLASSARAQTTYSQQNLLFGGRFTSGTGTAKDFLFNLGAVSQVTSLAPGASITFDLNATAGGFATLLSSNFGSDYYTRVDPATSSTSLQWAIVAGSTLTDILYSTRNPSVQSTPFGSSADQSGPANGIATAGNFFRNNTVAAGVKNGLIQDATNNSSWAAFQPAPPNGANSGGISFGYFNPTNEGPAGSTLAFDVLNEGGSSRQIANVSFTSGGLVTFTAVPEPSTYLLSAVGTLALIALRRKARKTS